MKKNKNIEMRHFIKKVQKHSMKIINKLPQDTQPDKIISFQQLNEALLNLERIHAELIKIEREILDFSFEEPPKNFHELQLKYIGKTRSFHQEVYATISSLIKLIADLGSKELKSRLFNSSVEKFLKKVLSESESIRHLGLSVNILLHSRSYRAKFIDHPQNNKIYQYSTQSLQNEVAIIYFRGEEGGSSINPLINPFVIEDDKIFVPRHHTWVYNSVVNLVIYILKILNKR